MATANAMQSFDARTEARLLFSLLGRIALIVFLVEAIVMVMLSGWQLTREVLVVGLIDATALTLLASPLIYLWAAKPYALSAHEAQEALSRELDARARQSSQLEATLGELKDLLGQNETLRMRLQKSSVEFSTSNEMILQRIGADLHDGPAQMLSFALMRLHKFTPDTAAKPDGDRPEDLQRIRDALQSTLREVRGISSGLVLPELETLSLAETIFLSIGAHEERSDTTVSFDIGELPNMVSRPMKVCAYRFFQEGLANAWRHAGGRAQRAEARIVGDELVLRVSDKGDGISDATGAWGRGLGLPGLRGRVEAIGGTFDLQSAAGKGTTISATFRRDHLDSVGTANGT